MIAVDWDKAEADHCGVILKWAQDFTAWYRVMRGRQRVDALDFDTNQALLRLLLVEFYEMEPALSECGDLSRLVTRYRQGRSEIRTAFVATEVQA
jgi:hypothetical protein